MRKGIWVLSIVLVVALIAGCVGKETRTIVNEQFTVSPGQAKSYYADLKGGDVVDVSLTVLQGGNLDIDFYIADSDGRKIVSRDRVGETTLQWTVPSSGTYYFKYDNGMSLVASKIVNTTIKVTG